MTPRQPYADQCTRVYTRTGTRAHLMSPVQTIRNGSVLCHVLPEWFTEWHGTGSQDETDRAASLPLCRRCEDQARREDAYYGDPPQFTDPAASALAPVAPQGVALPGEPAASSPPEVAGGKTPRSHPAPQLPGCERGPSSPQLSERPAAGTPGPETGAISRAPVRARAESPAGASGSDSPPAGSSGEELRAAQRKTWKRAQSGHNHSQRAGRVRRAARQAGPGMVRRMPPGTPGDAA